MTLHRSVSFDSIEIIEIQVVLGDSPSLSTGGPPMTLGWECIGRTQLGLDFYETYRPKRKSSTKSLLISAKKRTKFFLRCGYELTEIEEAAAMSLNYRRQMTLTKLTGPRESMRDKAADRFASCHESEMEFMNPMALEKIDDHSEARGELLCGSRQRSNGAAVSSNRRIQRRASIGAQTMPRVGRMRRRLSSEPLSAPVRRSSPRRARSDFQRPISSEDFSSPVGTSKNKKLFSPVQEKPHDSCRWSISRHRSEPLTPARNQLLMQPERIQSPHLTTRTIDIAPNLLQPTRGRKLSPIPMSGGGSSPTESATSRGLSHRAQ